MVKNYSSGTLAGYENETKTLKTRWLQNLFTLLFVFSFVSFNVSIYGQCDSGYEFSHNDFTFIPNGTFTSQGGNFGGGIAAGADPATTTGTSFSVGFYSQAKREANNIGPSGSPDNGFSLQTGSVSQNTAGYWTGIEVNAFPGDPANNVPSTQGWYYSNGNAHSGGGEYLVWGKNITGLTVGRHYRFFCYYTNAIASTIDAPTDPVIRVRKGGSVDLPDGALVAGPITVTEAGTGINSALQGWRRLEFAFTATSTSQIIKFTDAGQGQAGDDFAMTRFGLAICKPIVNTSSTPSPACPGDNVTLSASSPVAGMTYHWSGPGGFSANGSTVTITSISNFGTYTVTGTDAFNTSNTQTVNVVQSNNCNNPPNAETNNETTPYDTNLTGNVITDNDTTYGTDSDPDGDAIQVTGFGASGMHPAFSTETIPGVGTVTINSDGTYVFNPDPMFEGTVPSIRYTISDPFGAVDNASLNITVSAPDCSDVSNNNLDICAYLTVNPTSTLGGLDCDGDGETNKDECDNGPTDPTDPCDYTSNLQTVATSGAWNIMDCDDDGEPNSTDPKPLDPCVGANLLNVNLNDTNSIWFTADCDGDGTINGDEIDPDGNGVVGPNESDYLDPCDDVNGVNGNEDLTSTSDYANADCDGDGVTNADELDPDGDNTPGPDGTDPEDPCDYNAVDITLPQIAPWTGEDCDGDGEPNVSDPDPQDPCVGTDLANVDLNDHTTDWYTADCDGDGTPNGEEVDPNGDGTAGPNGSDPTNPCDDINGVNGNEDLTSTSDYANADCDGDGVTNATEIDPDGDNTPGPNGTDSEDPCDYNAADVTLMQVAPWTNEDCDGDGEPNVTDPDPQDPCVGTDLANVDLNDHTTDWYTADCDGDGTPNGEEVDPDGDGTAGPNGSDPTDPCDDVNLVDGNEDLTSTSDYANADCDGDGVTNATEIDPDGDNTPGPNGTDPEDPCDYDAANVTLTQVAPWTTADCDGDGEPNVTDPNPFDPCEGGNMVNVDLTDHTTDWYTADCDGDGTPNGEEVDPDGDGTAGPNGSDPTDPCDDVNGIDGHEDLSSSSDYAIADCDGDGVTNGSEIDPDGDNTPGPNGTNPEDPCDYNVAYITLPQTIPWTTADCDGDGEPNVTDPNPFDPCEGGNLANVDLNDQTSDWYTADCDGDGTPNGEEVDPDGDGTAGPNGSDPYDPCDDINGIDGNEDLSATSDYANADCDGDGVTNAQEELDGTDPTDPCSLEVEHQGTPDTAWLADDCDNDGVTNEQELTDTTDPLDPCSYNVASVDVNLPDFIASLNDCDNDGLTDYEEISGNDNPNTPANPDGTITDPQDDDSDDDGIIDGNEYLGADGNPLTDDGTNPNDPDSDNDGILDGTEIGLSTPEGTDTDTSVFVPDNDPTTVSDPNDQDTDDDGIIDGNEDADHDGMVDNDETDPLDEDTDDDGIMDGTEIGLSTPQTPDTDTTTGNWVADQDPSTTTDPLDQDSDDDGIIDGNEDADHDGMVDVDETDPNDVDTDDDGIQDGTESGIDTPQGTGNDTDPNVFIPDGDTTTTTDPLDQDTDDDGLMDGTEDVDHDGTVDPTETDPNDVDTDNDGIQDGTESGLETPETSDTDLGIFIPDGDGSTTTDPLDQDTDDDGLMDGTEDADHNGVVDAGETDPANPDTDEDGIQDGTEAGLDTAETPDTDLDIFVPDTDPSTTTDNLNPDSDGDGVLDGTEDGNGNGNDDEVLGETDPNDPCDFNIDQITVEPSDEWKNLDCDGDGVINIDEINDGTDSQDPCEFDYENVSVAPSAEWLALDCDNDGIPNGVEYGNDPLNPVDTDGDNTPDIFDTDSDNDSVPDSIEGGATGVDTDGDGIDDAFDVDQTGGTDVNGDGVDDNPATQDTDGDNHPDYLDIDDDNDGILTDQETANAPGDGDTDGDNLPDYLDQDADDDGIPDNVEGQSTEDYVSPTGIDTDGDGLDDAYDDTVGFDNSNGIDPEDTDNDSEADYLDLDSDNDGVADTTEAFDTDEDGEANTVPSGNDENMNGIDDAFEDVVIVPGTPNYSDPNGSLDNGSIDTNDTDGQGVGTDENGVHEDVDYRDTDDDNDGTPTGDGQGEDDFEDCDNDGTPNYLDPDPCDLIPSGFSPNGDGDNDTFIIPGVSNSPNFTLKIYNRWGNIVYDYENKGRTNPEWWNGYSNGRWTLSKDSELVPVGTYFYIINFNDGNKEPYQGWIYVNY